MRRWVVERERELVIVLLVLGVVENLEVAVMKMSRLLLYCWLMGRRIMMCV